MYAFPLFELQLGVMSNAPFCSRLTGQERLLLVRVLSPSFCCRIWHCSPNMSLCCQLGCSIFLNTNPPPHCFLPSWVTTLAVRPLHNLLLLCETSEGVQSRLFSSWVHPYNYTCLSSPAAVCGAPKTLILILPG